MIRTRKHFFAWAFGLMRRGAVWQPAGYAANSVSAGVFTVERPTLMSAGFDWRITGDDNHNAKVDVQYRKKGDEAWKTGLPLLRAGGGGEIRRRRPRPGRQPLFALSWCPTC